MDECAYLLPIPITDWSETQMTSTEQTFALRQSKIDTQTGKVFSTWETTAHGWASEQAARKAWKDRPWFKGDGYLLDFSMLHINTVSMLEFVPAA